MVWQTRRMEPADFDVLDLSVQLQLTACLMPPEPEDEIEQWRATLLLDSDDPVLEVASAEFLIVPPGISCPGVALDALSAEAAEFACMFDGDDLSESLECEALAGLIVVERVQVVARLQGKGLGPLLVAEALKRLGRDSAVAACSDRPFLAAESTDELADRSQIRRMVRDFGFVEWNDGLWTLDLATTDLEATRRAIREARLPPLAD